MSKLSGASEPLLEIGRRFDCGSGESWEAAEIVAGWVWVEFEDKQPVTVTRALAELGFHWNRLHQAWQHPCGIYRDRRAVIDPRYRYGSYAATDPQNPINATSTATTKHSVISNCA